MRTTATRSGPLAIASDALAAGLLWLLLAEGRGLGIGLLTVVVAVLAARWTPRLRGPRPTFTGLVRFVPWALAAAWRGALDVAGRALARDPRLSPGWVRHRTRLPPGRARTAFVTVLNLMPGTVGVRFEGDTLEVHVLQPAASAGLPELERRVARLYGLEAGREVSG